MILFQNWTGLAQIYLEDIDVMFTNLKPVERKVLLEKVASIYCPHCGDAQPKDGRTCQCWNNE